MRIAGGGSEADGEPWPARRPRALVVPAARALLPALAVLAALAVQTALPQAAFAEEPGRSIPRDLYRAQMAAAESAMRLGEFAAARAWLDETEPSGRGFEWKVFDASLDESLTSLPTGEAHATALDTSPDGRLVAVGLSDGGVEIMNVSADAPRRRLGTHEGVVYDVRFDGAGQRVVTASHDKTVKVWDVATGAILVDFRRHNFAVGGAAFSPDGRLVASGSFERPPGTVVGTVHLWNASDGSFVRTLEGGRKPLSDIAFSPDGRTLAASSWDFCVFVWNVSGVRDVSGGEPRTYAVPDEGLYRAVDGVAFSPDGRLVAGASKDRTARVWRVETGELVATLRGHTDFVAKLAFSPDGALVATASSDGTLRLWSAADWTPLGVMRGHADAVTDVRFAAAGSRLVSGSQDGTVRLWDASARWYGAVTLSPGAAPYAARFSPGDGRLASCGFDGRVHIWSARAWDLLASWRAHARESSCHMLDWSPDGRRLATGSYDRTVRIWDAVTLKELARLDHDDPLIFMRMSPDGRLLAAAGGSAVSVWDVAAARRMHVLEGHGKTVLSLAFSPDSKRLVSTGRDGKAIVWDAASGRAVFEVPGRSADVADAAFTPDGATLLVAGRDGAVFACRASDGSALRDLARSPHGIDHIAVSPDGARAAIASNVVGLIDLAGGGIVARLRPHADSVFGVDFDGRGERLVSASPSGTIAISDTRPLRQRLRERDAALADRAAAEVRVSSRLASGETLGAIADAVPSDRALSPGARAAWIEALTRRAGAASGSPASTR